MQLFILTNMKLRWGLDDLAKLLCLNLQVCWADWGDSTEHAFILGPWLKQEKRQIKFSSRWWLKHRWERERKHTQGLKTYTQIRHIVTSTLMPLTKSHGKAQHQEGDVYSTHNEATEMEEGREKWKNGTSDSTHLKSLTQLSGRLSKIPNVILNIKYC